MRRKMKLMGTIMEKAYKLNCKTDNDIFVSYYGHVDQLEVRIYYEGWSEFKNSEYLASLYLTDKDALSKMQDVINKLDRLAEEEGI